MENLIHAEDVHMNNAKIVKKERMNLNFDEFETLSTLTARSRELLRMKFRSLAALEKIVEQNQEIIKLLSRKE